MAREILFKAKRADNGKWVKGIPSYDVNGDLSEFEIYKGFADCQTVDIEMETVCQCTGMTDGNGTKIFEGDIVRIDREDENFIVEWDSDSARFVMNGETLAEDFDSYYGYETEIIGNIFDNPELCEQGTISDGTE